MTASPFTRRPSAVTPMKYHSAFTGRSSPLPPQFSGSVNDCPGTTLAPGQEYQSAKSSAVNGAPVKLENAHRPWNQLNDPNSVMVTGSPTAVTEVSYTQVYALPLRPPRR